MARAGWENMGLKSGISGYPRNILSLRAGCEGMACVYLSLGEPASRESRSSSFL